MDREDKFLTRRGDLQKISLKEAQKISERQRAEIERFEEKNGLKELKEKYFGR